MKTKLLFYCLFFFGLFSTTGQTEAEINELLSRLEVNHMGSITDVFTTEELSILRTHFDGESSPSESGMGGGNNVFAPENVNGNFGSFDITAPTVFNIIGPSGAAAFEGAGCYDPVEDVFVEIDNDGEVYTIDPDTGDFVYQGTIPLFPGESITGLEYDDFEDEFYVISTDGAGNSTFSLLNTGDLTLSPIGNTGLILPIALAINTSGQAYTYDIDDDILYSLNKTTAAATPIGSIGFDANFGQGMFLNALDNKMYMTAFNDGQLRSELRAIDEITGATTLVGVIGESSPGGTLQFGWSSMINLDLGIGENLFNKVEVYPNPASTFITITNNQRVNIESLRIYDMMSRLINTIEIEGTRSEYNIDISNLDVATYVIVITTNEGVITKRFIKN